MDIMSVALGSARAAETGAAALAFVLIYLTGFVLFQNWPRMATPVVRRHMISGLSAAVAAVTVGFWLHAADGAAAAVKEQTQGGPVIALSPFLPAQVFEDRSIVYPGHY